MTETDASLLEQNSGLDLCTRDTKQTQTINIPSPQRCVHDEHHVERTQDTTEDILKHVSHSKFQRTSCCLTCPLTIGCRQRT